MAEVNVDVAKEESVQAVNTKVGTSSDTASSTPATLFAGIKGLIAWFTGTWTAVRAGYVDTTYANTAVNNTASKTGTLSQKESYGIGLLENATYGLSALKTAIAGGSTPIVKSIQRGKIPKGATTNLYEVVSGLNRYYIDINISTINVNKSIGKVDILSGLWSVTVSNKGRFDIVSANTLRVYVSATTAIINCETTQVFEWELTEFY